MSILQQPTLVLNRSWSPINTVSVKKALTMVWGEWEDDKHQLQPKAYILDIDTGRTYDWDEWSTLVPSADDDVIHGANGNIYRAPEIIIVTRYNKASPRSQLNFNRRNLFSRDGNQCQYCGGWPGNSHLSIDHVIPRSKGGGNTWENCVTACLNCNQKKGDKTAEQAGMKLLSRPTKPRLEVLGSAGKRIRSWEVYFGREAARVSEIA